MNTDHVVVKGNDLWCKACGQREPLQLPLSVKDFSHFCQTWAQAHEQCAAVDQTKTLRELRRVANDLLEQNNRMREEIATLPDTLHYEWAQQRSKLRQAAGLKDKP